MERAPQVPVPAEDTLEHEPVLGPGRCKACDCRGFKATGKKNDVCATCGHYWQMHAPT